MLKVFHVINQTDAPVTVTLSSTLDPLITFQLENENINNHDGFNELYNVIGLVG